MRHILNKSVTGRAKTISTISSILVMLTLWYASTVQFSLIPKLYLPSPIELSQGIMQIGSNLFLHSLITFARVLGGFFLGTIAGLLVGLVLTRYQILFAVLEPLIETLRPIPPIALIPFFILWFGIGTLGKLFLAGLGCFMVLLIATIEAVRNIPKVYLEAAATLGASRFYTYKRVVLPAISLELIAASRVSLALAFALMTAAELMGAQAGLGYMIMVARRSLNTPIILLAILLIGLQARVADVALSRLATRLTGWSERKKEL